MKLVWDEVGKRFYETGVDHGVLYVMDANGAYPTGVAWNGLIGVSEKPSGAEATPLYADNIKYLNLISAEEFAAGIEAYTYPKEFEACDGTAEGVLGVNLSQQVRKSFGLVYRTIIGNDVAGQSLGYKLHLIYGAMAAPSEKGYQTINDSPEALTFSWEITTTPVEVTGFKPTAAIVIDSTKANATKLAALEDILFGVTTPTPIVARLPLPNEIITLMTPPAG